MESQRSHRRDEPQPLGDVLSHLFTLRGYGRTGTSRQLGDIWRTLAGEQIADRTRVLGIKAGVLQIGVAGSAQLQELDHFHKHSLLESLQSQHPDLHITGLRFRLHTPAK
jgi:predicted nucleic acid-binding Zn ribbon protein